MTMTTYEYGNNNYTKRPLTENLLLHVITCNPGAIRTEAYEKAAMVTKGAELASQADACPMIGRELIIPVYNRIRRDPGMRARDVQTGSAAAAAGFDSYTEEDAACQIACGTLANIAASYTAEAADQMLTHGILPLVSRDQFPVGTMVYIRGILHSLQNGETSLAAYRFEQGEFVAVQMEIGKYTESELEKILG